MDEKQLAEVYPASYKNLDVIEFQNYIHNTEA